MKTKPRISHKGIIQSDLLGLMLTSFCRALRLRLLFCLRLRGILQILLGCRHIGKLQHLSRHVKHVDATLGLKLLKDLDAFLDTEATLNLCQLDGFHQICSQLWLREILLVDVQDLGLHDSLSIRSLYSLRNRYTDGGLMHHWRNLHISWLRLLLIIHLLLLKGPLLH